MRSLWNNVSALSVHLLVHMLVSAFPKPKNVFTARSYMKTQSD